MKYNHVNSGPCEPAQLKHWHYNGNRPVVDASSSATLLVAAPLHQCSSIAVTSRLVTGCEHPSHEYQARA